MRIGSSSYSFKRLSPHITAEEHDRTLLSIIDEAPQYGLAGLELLAVQFESEERAYLNTLKRNAMENGLDLYALSLHNNFVKTDAALRTEEVNKVLRWIDVAYHLGIPVIRLFGGRWDTLSFMELMERDGIEEPLPGYEYGQAVEWNIECFEQIIPKAADLGIVLTVENHWGITYSAQGVLDIIRGVDSPWLKVIMDCGNFLVDTYGQLEQLAPHTVMVHAKSYQGGGLFYDLDIDYTRIFRMLKQHNFGGYVSLEYEGRMEPSIVIPGQVKLLEEVIRHA